MPNQLIHSKNPYLRQHADNPVDWMQWGEAAFAKARQEDKPIFLSIGYSTCHWCHVMAHECFEQPQIAAYLNDHFVSIKVDREERPDVDHLYMMFVQATTGTGGWPLTVFLTPELKPFFGGTYFPPVETQGRVGFGTLLGQIAAAWKNQRDRIEESGLEVIQALSEMSALKKGEASSNSWRDIFDQCLEDLNNAYDSDYGGFGGAPLFPRPVTYDFLHLYHTIADDPRALDMSSNTLLKMSEGGIHDQLGGGFHRYSVDHYWMVPHFEKMLYDQAQLAVSFLEMYQLSSEETYANTARDTLNYVLRDLGNPAGGFYAAEDADSPDAPGSSNTHEGLFYIWAEAEIDAALPDKSALVKERYNVRKDGNTPAEGDLAGAFHDVNILYIAKDLNTLAEQFGITSAAVWQQLESDKEVLFNVRARRPRPHRDEKIIPAWNGLTISALAKGGRILNHPAYIQAAEKAAHFIKDNLYDAENGILGRHYCEGAAGIDGFSSDYAGMIAASIDLYEATFDTAYLEWAEQMVAHLQKYFWDANASSFYDAGPDPHLLLRFKTDQDSAEPAPNSLLAWSLLKLANLLGRTDLEQAAEQIFDAYHLRVKTSPTIMPKMLSARIISEESPQHIVLVGKTGSADLEELQRELSSHYLPLANSILLTEENRKFWDKRLPWTKDMQMQEGKATAYICKGFTCQAPVTTADDIRRIIGHR